MIAQAHGWRMAFVALGAPGLLVALLVVRGCCMSRRGLIEQAWATRARCRRSRRWCVTSSPCARCGTSWSAGQSAHRRTGGRAVHAAAVHAPVPMPMGEAATLFGSYPASRSHSGCCWVRSARTALSHRDERWPAWGPTWRCCCAPVLSAGLQPADGAGHGCAARRWRRLAMVFTVRRWAWCRTSRRLDARVGLSRSRCYRRWSARCRPYLGRVRQ